MLKVAIQFRTEASNNPIQQIEKSFDAGDWKKIGEWIAAVILVFPGQADIKIRY